MGALSLLGVVVVLVVGLFVFMQIAVARRARAMRGQVVGSLPGQTGVRIGKLDHALVYFFSPQCASCRAITPRVRELAQGNRAVFAVDVMNDMELARALGVMATPSTVEIEGGKIVGYHIGQIPGAVMQRFAKA
ncbi:MAG TPA: thioredoxin family protein [Polyangiaceae bacterium]|nr:thioredoxin family protein [Polyangiaceae bacterium]